MFIIIDTLGIIFTLYFLLFYGGAKLDYNMACVPTMGSPPYPRCVTDLNDMNYYGALTAVCFSVTIFGLYLNRRTKPAFFLFLIASVFLGIGLAFISLI